MGWRAFFGRERPIGVVDTRSTRIKGWAFDKASPTPVTLDFFVDGTNAGSTVANLYRADLTSECPDGRCAFDFTLPDHVLDGSLRTVEVRARGTQRPLLASRFTSQLLPTEHYSAMLRQILRAGAWSMSATRTNGALEIDGWCVAPPGTDEGAIHADERKIDVAMSDGYADWKTPLPSGVTVRTFRGHVPISSAQEHIRFSYGADQSFLPLQDLHCPLFDIAVPDAESRKRVDGNGAETDFNIGGYSTARKLDVITTRFAGKPLAQLGPVLDWGCGCGRVARFVARSGADLYGIDVDRDAARWCGEHIRGHFTGIPLDPPTAFADNMFSAVYGISVFTHLNKAYEQAWLTELHRIAKPGALLLLSIHGGMAAVRAGMVEHAYSPEFADGFVDIGRNPDIDNVTKGTPYYRNVFHQFGYIAKTWGRHFEILAIEEGIIDNRQDLVIARKPV